ncbi:hypothetical protein HYO50_19585 [Vibrio parahaemolyticus]|uniref:hypothetical protein n=1 Tax=Vibrio parahaemolyticus TaxID=670 RepID=UPI001784DE3F|nr:hypothetical protein [Vibrio parahaemolyticus]EGQ7783898.1 hypothetical protein [Vibrio parahaemolyticus]EIA1496688.1 hypothetical protein [Vibrio parahaemolyticus]EJG0961244.1 hypothetical protein [Vibrio parahaemolyticus]ELJ8865313.1 hypothetical protein [Vibrio parahaemolyticus]MBD6966551.1 hypothetical protein [Vibrio parahaemolyticus]
MALDVKKGMNTPSLKVGFESQLTKCWKFIAFCTAFILMVIGFKFVQKISFMLLDDGSGDWMLSQGSVGIAQAIYYVFCLIQVSDRVYGAKNPEGVENEFWKYVYLSIQNLALLQVILTVGALLIWWLWI